MTLEELNQHYTDASWLIARNSAAAAGKALMFGNESVEETTVAIARIYGLSEEEIASLTHGKAPGTDQLAGVKTVAQGLLGTEAAVDTGTALTVARTAIENGHARKMLTALVSHGPGAAKAVAETGKLASKGMPWGWIAAAGYAVGSAGWFAYNARAFNLEVFEFVRKRDGIEDATPPPEPETAPDTDVSDGSGGDAEDRLTLSISLPTPAAVASKANELSDQAGAAISGLWGRLRRTKPE